MKEGSLFIFDFWNAHAVVGHYKPGKRNIFTKTELMLSGVQPQRFIPPKRCEVNYTCTLRQDGRVIRRDKEKHVLRYFSLKR